MGCVSSAPMPTRKPSPDTAPEPVSITPTPATPTKATPPPATSPPATPPPNPPQPSQPSPPPDHNLALIRACKSASLSSATSALTAGADPNHLAMWSSTPLLIACQYHASEIATLLIRHGADARRVNEKNVGALTHACVEGLGGVVAEILAKWPDMGESCEERGKVYVSGVDRNVVCGPVRGAIVGGHGEVLSMLMRAGFKVEEDVGDGDGSGGNSMDCLAVPLLCCMRGDGDILGVVIHALKDSQVRSALRLAASATVREGGVDPLTVLMRHKPVEVGAAITLVGEDGSGMTPLHAVCEKGAGGRVAVLLEGMDSSSGTSSGMNVKCKKKGWTALMYFVASSARSPSDGSAAILEVFASKGADFACQDKHKRDVSALAKKNRKKLGEESVELCEEQVAKSATKKDEAREEEEAQLPGAM